MSNSEKDQEESKSILDQVEGGVKKSADIVKDKLPSSVSKVIQNSDDPIEAKEQVKDEISDEAGEFFRDQFQKQMQSKIGNMKEELQEKTSANADHVHNKAEEAKKKVQDRLLSFREKLSSVKETGNQIQDSLQTKNSSDGRVKGVQDIKGVSHIKSASSIKSSKDIKGLSNIKTYHS